jgi:predicted nucleic acid-binding protein
MVVLIDSNIIIDYMLKNQRFFEDAVQFSAGNQVNADYIVTRDPKGFSHSTIEIIDPQSLIAILAPESME